MNIDEIVRKIVREEMKAAPKATFDESDLRLVVAQALMNAAVALNHTELKATLRTSRPKQVGKGKNLAKAQAKAAQAAQATRPPRIPAMAEILGRLKERFKVGEGLDLTAAEIAKSLNAKRGTVSNVLAIAAGTQRLRNGTLGTGTVPAGLVVTAGESVRGAARTWTIRRVS